MTTLIADRDSALLLIKIRNLIQEETGMRIPISEEGAIDRFIEMAEESQNEQLHEASAKLKEMIGIEDPSAEPLEQGSVRVYRGVVQSGYTAPESDSEDPPARPIKGKVITYRGQKMII